MSAPSKLTSSSVNQNTLISLPLQQRGLNGKYDKLKETLNQRKKKFQDAQKYHEFLRDVEHEEIWIHEWEPVVSSTNLGKDLTGAKNLSEKHQALMTEMTGHEARINDVMDDGKR